MLPGSLSTATNSPGLAGWIPNQVHVASFGIHDEYESLKHFVLFRLRVTARLNRLRNSAALNPGGINSQWGLACLFGEPSMGATVTVGKKVGAFIASNGKTGYVLFEETYEKNCYPHTPNWSCVGMGYIEDVMSRIFGMASSCEGGGLQGKGGYITPEGYISGWLSELAEPMAMSNIKKTLAFGDNFYATIPESLRAKVLQGLEDEGLVEQAGALRAQGFEASLYDDLEVLRAIYVKHRNELGPWRFIDRSTVAFLMYNPIRKELGYAPAKNTTYKPAFAQMFSIYEDRVAMQCSDGKFRMSGERYSVTAHYIEQYAATEIAYPGTYRKSIKAFREAVKAAPKASDETKVYVTMDGLEPSEKYRRELIQDAAVALGKSETDFVVNLSDLRSASNNQNHLLYRITSLSVLVWEPQITSIPSKQETLFDDLAMA